MTFRIPAHIDPLDLSPAAYRARAMHAQNMMALRPNGDGFARTPENSAQNSIVERHLIAAGDMEPNKITPPKRALRKAAARDAYLERCRSNRSNSRGNRGRSGSQW